MDSNINLMTSVFELIPKTKHEDILKDLLQHVDVKSQNKKKETILHILARLGYAHWIEELLSFDHNLEVDIDIIGPDGNTPLMVAAENGQLKVLELLIEKKADVNKQNFAKCNALHLATMNSHIKCIKKLVSCQCNINVQDLTKLTPLLIATFCGHEETFDFLLESKAEVNLRDEWYHNSLHYAVFNGNLNFVEKLVDADIELNVMATIVTYYYRSPIVYLQRTPLMIAAERGFDQIVEFLLKHGAKDYMSEKLHRNALLLAAFNGHIECFKKLGGGNIIIQSGDVSLTPLLLAAEGGRKNIIDYLLPLGNNIDFCGPRGNVVNYLLLGEYTVKNGFIAEIIRSLASKLKVDFRSDIGKKTALIYAAEWYTYDVSKVLLSSGADINACDNFNKSALHYAVKNNISVVKELVEAKIDINIQDIFGQTALMEAFSYDERAEEIVNYLITSKANINLICQQKKNALHYAVEFGFLSAVQKLIEIGINMNLKDYSGRTPLLISVDKRLVKIAQYLINSGADVNLCDNTGKNALDYAFQVADLTLVEQLIDTKTEIKIPYALTHTSPKIIKFLLTSNQTNCKYFFQDDLNAIYFAVSCGLVTITEKLIKTIDNINFEYLSQRKTLLMEAASRGHQDILELIIEAGADVNYRNEQGKNALHFVHNVACTKVLIDKGIRFDIEDKYGYTPLMSAAEKGQREIVEYILKNLRDENLKKSKYNAWKRAVAHKYFKCAEILDTGLEKEDYESSFLQGLQCFYSYPEFYQFVQYYVKHKIDINIQDDEGMGLIHYEAGYFKKINEFVVNISNFDISNNKGETALILAAKRGNVQNIKALLNFGSNPNKQDKNGRNALHHLLLSYEFINSDFDKCLILLLDSEVNVNAVDNEQKTALKILIEKCLYVGNLKKYVNLLLESGADCNIRDDCGRTPLMLALINRCVDILNLLLRSGAYVDIKDNIGQTPLMLAIKSGYIISFVESLLKLSKDINIQDDNGQTPLMLAIITQQGDIAKLLINSNADVNITDINGQTALMMAVDNGDEDSVDFLLNHGANVKICDKNGLDAFNLACSKGHKKIIKRLVDLI